MREPHPVLPRTAAAAADSTFDELTASTNASWESETTLTITTTTTTTTTTEIIDVSSTVKPAYKTQDDIYYLSVLLFLLSFFICTSLKGFRKKPYLPSKVSFVAF